MFRGDTCRQFRGRWMVYALLATVVVVLGDEAIWACPNCRDAMAGDPAQAGLVRGFFWSILFMLSMPFLILGGLSSYFYWEVCRARRAAQAKQVAALASGMNASVLEGTAEVSEGEPVGAA